MESYYLSFIILFIFLLMLQQQQKISKNVPQSQRTYVKNEYFHPQKPLYMNSLKNVDSRCQVSFGVLTSVLVMSFNFMTTVLCHEGNSPT